MTHQSKKQDALFLVDQFDIAPGKAALLVMDNPDQAESLGLEVKAEVDARDPLAGLPVPDHGKDKDHEERGVEDLHKPVDRRESAPT